MATSTVGLDDGGPAFPVKTIHITHLPNGKTESRHERLRGMSLRAYFAGQAMVGLCSNDGQVDDKGYLLDWSNTVYEGRAEHCVRLADALIAELNSAH